MTSTEAHLEEGSRRETIIVAGLLGLITFLIFSPALSYGFLNYDDPDFVTANARIQQGLTWAGISWAFSSLFIYWQPLTWISYMVDVELWGLNPRGFHLTNLLLHVANTLVLFVVLKRMTKTLWASAFVAALFAVHPLHVETVAWISERKGALSTLFWLLALWAYLRYVERPHWKSYLLVAVWFACGLMSKSMVVTLPCVLLLLDFWPLRRLRLGGTSGSPSPGESSRTWAQLLVEKLPLFAMAAASSYLTVMAQRGSAAILSLDQLSLGDRAGYALLGYLGYLRQTFLPGDLAVFYPFPETLSMAKVALASVILAGISIAAVVTAKRAPWILVGWFWFIGTLLPVSGLFQTGDQAMADRYTYIPLIGLFIAIAWTAVSLRPPSVSARFALGVPALVVVAACVILTGMQLRHWRDTVALFEQARTATRRNHVAAAILANAAADEKQWDLANSLYAEALAYKERYADGHAGFAGALIRQGRSPEAGKHYQRALEIHPGRADARHGLALLLLQQNQAPEAVTEFRRALELDPNLSQAHAGLAIALQVLGRTDEANATYARVAGVSPGSAASYLSFGNFLITQGRAGEAIPCFQRVLELDPKSVDALGRLAWIHATHQNDALRNAGEALRLAQLACDLTGNRDALSVNTLAAAYAESGQFPKAIETAQKALDLANAYGQSRITMVIQNLLELYKSGKPYRE